MRCQASYKDQCKERFLTWLDLIRKKNVVFSEKVNNITLHLSH